MAQMMENAINKIIFFISIILASSSLYARGNYYRLDDYDANYNKLQDPPLNQEPQKQLHPSSIYKQQRPAGIQKEPDYSRREIANNNQAANRLAGYQINPAKLDYFLLGIGGGIDIYAYDEKRQISLDLYAKLGYFRYINLNAIRIYANLGGRIPLANSNPRTLSFSGNIDFLLNLKIFHIYAGLGYGSEYYTSQKFFSQGLNINLGLSKQLGRGAIDVGLVIPFYTIYTKDVIIKNNIIFLLEYSYKI